jgi:hypothetical protein
MKSRDSRQTPDWVEDARAEISAMARQGIAHPSSKPVLIGVGLGALAGALVIGAPIPGGLAGTGRALHQRIRR